MAQVFLSDKSGTLPFGSFLQVYDGQGLPQGGQQFYHRVPLGIGRALLHSGNDRLLHAGQLFKLSLREAARTLLSAISSGVSSSRSSSSRLMPIALFLFMVNAPFDEVRQFPFSLFDFAARRICKRAPRKSPLPFTSHDTFKLSFINA